MLKAFEEFKKKYQNKKVLILGLGLQGGGVGDARFFAEIGAQVTVTDLKSKKELASSLKKLQDLKIKYVLGQHRNEDILNSDLIIRNASVPWNSPYLQLARQNNIPIEMDASLFAQYCPWPVIGVTGTRGKTTTATLIYELLKGAGKNALLGGNVYGKATLPLLKKIDDQQKGWVVLELSSWQLQAWRQAQISPQISVITNLYPDHLNFYQSMADYIEDKKVILQFQKKKDYAVLNQDDEQVEVLAKETKAKVVYFSKDDFPKDWSLKLSGEHNLANASAAFQVGQLVDLSPREMQPVFTTFKGIEFRLEEIGIVDGVKYINDSTSTMPEATISALKTIETPVILIAGGASKNLPMKNLAQAVVKKVKAVVLLTGEGTEELKLEIEKAQGSKLITGNFKDLKKAVLAAKKIAQPGDTILFSPGCASFGMFSNEFERAREFNRLFQQLKLK